MGGKEDQSQQPVRKRNRLTVVCSNCRRRKSKCDRQTPCGNCVRLGDKDTCVYIKEAKGDRNSMDLRITKKLPTSKRKNSVTNTKKSVSFDSVQEYVPEYISLIPNGRFIEVKRSTMTIFSLLTDIAIEHRDPYLKSLITFRMIAIEMTVKRLRGNKEEANSNPSLPQSFAPLSIFDSDGDPLSSEGSFKQHQLIHKSLFDKFGKYRKDDSAKFDEREDFIGDNLPPATVFFEDILPFFENYILSIAPIFSMELLKHEINEFYKSWDSTRKLSIKGFDHIVYCIVLLITKLCQLSINFSKYSSKLQSRIQTLNTNKYIAIVNHFLFEMKTLRKCTLMQLQCLLLLRLYHWCGPEDGDGEVLQHGQILLGTIISSCKEMGITWLSLLTPDDYFFKLDPACRPSPAIMSRDDYKKILGMIWSFVLYWDRKMCLINGQECYIEKSFAYHASDPDSTWHQRMTMLDVSIYRINNLLNDMPGEVDAKMLDQEINQALEMFEQIKPEQDAHMNLEFELMIHLCHVTILHAKMVYYEYQIDVDHFHEAIQALWDQIILLTQICYKYCNDDDPKFDPFTRFYTNKIVGIVLNRICVLIPAMILRLNRFPQFGFTERNLMVKFLFGISSMYFNEFGFDYYRCFKKMFTAKISYKILNRPAEKEPWQIILHFLLHDLEKIRNGKKMDDVDIVRRIPLLVDLQETLRKLPDDADVDVLETWNSTIYPIGKLSESFVLDLHPDQLQFLLIDRYANSFNIFASFYDHASSRLADSAEDANAELNIPSSQNQWASTPNIGLSKIGLPQNGTGYAPTTNSDLELANFELIQEMFEPLDFISFF
ncbi:Oaf3p TDEL_0H00790 [Torulaspora delbrueckii]|uniref:Oleate activated transcription factor 3 n=1 Tax=Torulaspora delbrueckii TaxID=4950 RepID=G8ZZ94_TORDE|nr:hypothetical protein TDEL_0H00790 [Torulaspora delbrueckii]CCE93938.1 hypothetical protein TDEL_0H00790 [Torulaspora delbrueckii]